MENTCEYPSFTAHRIGEEMVHIEMKNVKKLIGLDVEQIYGCHKKIGNGKKVYVLVTFQGFIPLSDEAMKEAKKQGLSSRQGAVACVVHDFSLRMGLKFFMNFYKPVYPINICKTKSEAITWLKFQKKKDAKRMAA